MEYYSAIKKNEIMPFAATWTGLEIIILSEVRQAEKDIYNIAYVRNLKKNRNELFTKQKQTHRLWKTNLWLPKGKWGGAEIGNLGLTDTHYYI